MAGWRLGGWLSRVWNRRSPAALDPPNPRAVLEAYAACLERRPAGRLSAERELPYSKEVIGRVILRALEVGTDERLLRPLRQSFVDLETFIGDDEWQAFEEHERHAGASASREAMTPLQQSVEERKARRWQLLEILRRERAGS